MSIQQQSCIEAMKEARSVIRSINASRHHQITVGGETVYWQRDEWVRWALDEVLPVIDQAIARAEGTLEAEKQEPACCNGKCPNKKECENAMHCLYTRPYVPTERQLRENT
jgi:hypothetical protein